MKIMGTLFKLPRNKSCSVLPYSDFPFGPTAPISAYPGDNQRMKPMVQVLAQGCITVLLNCVEHVHRSHNVVTGFAKVFAIGIEIGRWPFESYALYW